MEACFQLNDIFVVSSFSLCPSCQHNFSLCCFQFPRNFMLCWPPCVHSSIEVIFCIFFFAQRKDIKLLSYSRRNPFQKEIWVPLYLLLDFRAHFCLFIFRKLVCSSLNDVRIVLCLTTDPLQFLNAVKCGGPLSPYHERRETDPGDAAR